MSGEQAPDGPHRGLLDWLKANRVEYELHEHPTTFTARETARAEHVSPAAFAKAIGVVTDDGRRALVVLDADDRLDLAQGSHRARRLSCPAHDRRRACRVVSRMRCRCDAGRGSGLRVADARGRGNSRRPGAHVPRREPPIHRPRRSSGMGASPRRHVLGARRAPHARAGLDAVLTPPRSAVGTRQSRSEGPRLPARRRPNGHPMARSCGRTRTLEGGAT